MSLGSFSELGDEKMRTRIILADEQALFRDAIRGLMERREDLAVVGEADNGPSAVALIERLEPEIAVTDIALPRLSGIEVTRRLARSGMRCRFLVLSDDSGGTHLKQAFAAGAAAFVCKTDPSEHLLQAVDALKAGRRYVSPSSSHHLAEIVAAGESPTPAERLSSREREIVQLIAEGLSSKEIATSLSISARTVESHRANVMQKLDIHKVPGLVRFAIREGLVSP
jgi:DNA-binding NarL/FixJ family response regulator